MARFDCTGLDDLIKEMQQEGVSLTGQVAEEMLIAGAQRVKEAWREAARKHHHIDTGDMFDSIDYSKKSKHVGSIKWIDIYPQGKDRNGMRNAEKAFLIHYGTSQIPASHWVDDADRLCDGTVVEAMQQVFNNRKGEH